MKRPARHETALASLALLALVAPSAESQGRPGSLLFFAEYDTGSPGLLTVTNSNSDPSQGDVTTRWVYVDADGCSVDTRDEPLLPHDTLSVVPSAHAPAGTRGYAYVFASNAAGQPIAFDHLIGSSIRFDPVAGASYSIEPLAFRAGAAVAQGATTDVDADGVRDLDGIEYATVPDLIFVPRFLGQSNALRSDLILIPLVPAGFSTIVDMVVWNDNEEPFTLQEEVLCWARVPLTEISFLFTNTFLQSTNHSPLEILGASQQEAGWFGLEGLIANSPSSQIASPGMLAFLAEQSAAETSAGAPFGLGERAAELPSGAPPVQPPSCPSGVAIDLWPPNHDYVSIDLAAVAGVVDPAGLPVTITVTSITQDEPVDANGGGDGHTVCDGRGIGGSVAEVRAERQGGGDGRVYAVAYTASNTGGQSCDGVITVRVPHSQSGAPAVDGGQAFDSTEGCP